MFPQTFPVIETNSIFQIVRGRSYVAEQADFVYACWRLSGWFARQKHGTPRNHEQISDARGDETELTLSLYRELLSAQYQLKGEIGKANKGEDLLKGPPYVELLDWVNYLIQLVFPFLPC